MATLHTCYFLLYSIYIRLYFHIPVKLLICVCMCCVCKFYVSAWHDADLCSCLLCIRMLHHSNTKFSFPITLYWHQVIGPERTIRSPNFKAINNCFFHQAKSAKQFHKVLWGWLSSSRHDWFWDNIMASIVKICNKIFFLDFFMILNNIIWFHILNLIWKKYYKRR